MEGVSGIVAFVLVAQHGGAVIDTHGQIGIFALEYAYQFDDVGTSAQVVRFLEVTVVGSHFGATQVYEVCTFGKFAG